MNNIITKMKISKSTVLLATAIVSCSAFAIPSYAAIALDRTRVIFDGGLKAMSLSISNENKHLPYLAQAWIEDENGNKIQSPFTVLPPVQRLEPGKPSQVKIQALPAASQLPQDRETLYYFNLREIPPRSNKPNTLQIALQTHIKMFYRPQGIAPQKDALPWQDKMTLTRKDGLYTVINPTPYYITIIEASSYKGAEGIKTFKPIMVAPKSSASLNLSHKELGDSPILTYINDYGGRPKLSFNCNSLTCHVTPEK